MLALFWNGWSGRERSGPIASRGGARGGEKSARWRASSRRAYCFAANRSIPNQAHTRNLWRAGSTGWRESASLAEGWTSKKARLDWKTRRGRSALPPRYSRDCRGDHDGEAGALLFHTAMLPGKVLADMKAKKTPAYSTGRPELDARLDELVGSVCPGQEKEYVLQIATSALKLGLEKAKRGDLKIANTALKEMRFAFKMFTPYRQVPKVTVFGSARTEPGQPDYHRAEELGRRMAEAGWMVVTGAGSGIMGAAHRGAGRDMSFGVNIRLPFEQRANRTIRGDRKLLTFRYFFTRKLFLLKESLAVVLFPGGFGSLDECFKALTLLQTRKQTPIPVVMVENPESGRSEEHTSELQSRLHLVFRLLL